MAITQACRAVTSYFSPFLKKGFSSCVFLGLAWPAFDGTACSRCPRWLVEPSQHLSSQKVCQHYELTSKPYCAFSAYQVWLICSSNLSRLLPFTVKETDSVTSFSPDYISTCLQISLSIDCALIDLCCSLHFFTLVYLVFARGIWVIDFGMFYWSPVNISHRILWRKTFWPNLNSSIKVNHQQEPAF